MLDTLVVEILLDDEAVKSETKSFDTPTLARYDNAEDESSAFAVPALTIITPFEDKIKISVLGYSNVRVYTDPAGMTL